MRRVWTFQNGKAEGVLNLNFARLLHKFKKEKKKH